MTCIPLDVDARVQRALDRVRPYLGSHAGGVEYLGVPDGVARLRLEGSCHGCPSSTATVQLAITGAVKDAAPEVTDVVVEGMTAPPEPQLLQIGRRPEADAEGAAAGAGAAPGRTGRRRRRRLGDPARHRAAELAAGHGLRPATSPCWSARCAAPSTPTATRCAACGVLAGRRAPWTASELACPGCGRALQRAAGRAAAWTTRPLHLDPLPLLTDSQGVRVAVPETAGAVSGEHRACAGSSRRRAASAARSRSAARTAAAPHRRHRPGAAGGPRCPAGRGRLDRPAAAGRRAGRGDLRVLRRPDPGRARPRGRPRAVDADVRLPRVLPAVHPRPGRPGAATASIPDRYRSDPGRPLSMAEWDALEIPVGLAFFLRSSGGRRRDRVLPEPGRRHRVPPRPEAWSRIAAAHPLLGAAEPDVEAILISRGTRRTSSSASWCRSTPATSSPGGCGCSGAASTAGPRRGRASPSSSTASGRGPGTSAGSPDVAELAFDCVGAHAEKYAVTPSMSLTLRIARDHRAAGGRDRAALPDQDRADQAALLRRRGASG